MRRLVVAVVRAGAAIRFQDLVERIDDVGQVGAAMGAQRDVVEGALHIEDTGERLARHEEDAEAALVGHHVPGADGVDVFR